MIISEVSEIYSQIRWIQNPVLSRVWVRFPPKVLESKTPAITGVLPFLALNITSMKIEVYITKEPILFKIVDMSKNKYSEVKIYIPKKMVVRVLLLAINGMSTFIGEILKLAKWILNASIIAE